VEPGCGEALASSTIGDYCAVHRYATKRDHVRRVLVEEAAVAPSLPTTPKLYGEAIVVSDLHIPWHDPEALLAVCDTARLLGVDRLIIGGDLLHADVISKFDGSKPVPITDEINSAARVLGALEEIFSEIHIIPGNHDQRLGKMLSRLGRSEDGQNALKILAKTLGVEDDPEDVALGLFRRFFESPGVKVYDFPELVLNDVWMILHPASCSRVSPQTERKMANKHAKHIIGGHNHLVGYSFNEGDFVAANIGHLSADEKFAYVRTNPNTFPKMQKGFCCILCDEQHPKGYLLPIAIHEAWFSVRKLSERLQVSA
jgi:predicted phosphodiesterase